MDSQLRALLIERFGDVRQLERERPPTPYEITKRRLVLIGRKNDEADVRIRTGEEVA